MPEPLKNLYNDEFFNNLCDGLVKVIPEFDRKKFMRAIYSSEWKGLELKDRMHHITGALHTVLPTDYSKALATIKKLIDELRKTERSEFNFLYMFLPEYIEVYGIEKYNESVAALEFFTTFSSAEFAVRPFLVRYPERMMKQMLKWSTHSSAQVRRLATEGSRPRLPWAMGVPFLKKDPKPILRILENMKNDPSETVRRSVANNLNDISKDHPDVVLALAKKWMGKNSHTDVLLKHACRTLLKQGNKEALTLFDAGGDHDIDVSDVSLSRQRIRIGEAVMLSFNIKNNETKPVTLRIEYTVEYKKARGSSVKVFKVSEGKFPPGHLREYQRKLNFADLTTRIHYPGEHTITLIVNGVEKERVIVELVNS